jgi:hypothetical protein
MSILGYRIDQSTGMEPLDPGESPSLILDNWWNLETNHYAKCVTWNDKSYAK